MPRKEVTSGAGVGTVPAGEVRVGAGAPAFVVLPWTADNRWVGNPKDPMRPYDEVAPRGVLPIEQRSGSERVATSGDTKSPIRGDVHHACSCDRDRGRPGDLARRRRCKLPRRLTQLMAEGGLLVGGPQ